MTNSVSALERRITVSVFSTAVSKAGPNVGAAVSGSPKKRYAIWRQSERQTGSLNLGISKVDQSLSRIFFGPGMRA